MQWWARYHGDIVGGVTVAIVALPLALAFGIASGAGAAAGLYAAIFAGLVTSLFGGSPVQISGPTGPMIAVLVGIVSRFGLQGMFVAAALAGLMQIILGLAGLGRFVQYLPRPVISGFTHGVAIIIFAPQIPEALNSPVITLVTIIAIVLAKRFAKAVPASLFGLAAGILVNRLFIDTPHVVGAIPSALPMPSLPTLPPADIVQLIVPAFTICLLGSIESLLSAEVADQMTDLKHNSRRELIGQGIGNVASALVGGMPVSGVIARTTVNVNAGGRSRLSGVVHSLVLLLIVLFFGEWAGEIPLAVLSAILMVTAVQMVDWRNIPMLQRTHWTYTATLLATMLLTVLADLVVGVTVGVVLAALFVMADLTRFPVVSAESDQSDGRTQLLPRIKIPPHVDVTSLNGPLFFLGVRTLLERLQTLPQDNVHVIDFSRVPTIDESAVLALMDHLKKLDEKGTRIYLGGLQRVPLRTMLRLGLLDILQRRRVCKSLAVAIERAGDEAARLCRAA
ncbi:MAG: SulP family inorganic anion transporter [Limnochordia bacterium]